MELNENQKNQPETPGKNGGRRPGAGRPKGSTKRPQIRDSLTEEQKQKLLDTAWKLATDEKKPDAYILKFLLEQVHGKAPQSIDLTSDGKGLFLAEAIVIKEQDDNPHAEQAPEPSPEADQAA